MSAFRSVKTMLNEAQQRQLPLWEHIMLSAAEESGISREESMGLMTQRLSAMREADASYDPQQRSRSGLCGGDGEKMRLYVQSGESLCGSFIGDTLAAALRMGECNACMHRIVAAPTAGACGVLPAVLLPFQKHFGCSDEALTEALYVASGFGAVIAERASISGAEAGCQAEIGTAAAMSAAALVALKGGDSGMMANAVAFALKNMMGLACDPVAGLVEVPCVKRNAAGVMNALSAADMALAGIVSRIPPDEVIDAMAAVGASLPSALKETGKGGIAASPTAVEFRRRFFSDAKGASED